ncbi:gamma-glutamyl-gamma-aminobutyrate hydrolase family protein [Actinacidiphila sp. ITFR-21]|uniref:gamma-glutamyl-gamma-aminobutyrate hydrolase family protein n=1 Tax=Actinacidiphila sp. ITFR-21 TaxID=3075199 RepID=UPI0028899CB2|nr:gamma-glutamyl-gamma-aminobutyrate hydrolase family protein [Streptomyces sp. ITFR-21]WNI14661.1 gamma-glutamyl-gamma-aminobutyrate hydrolase family protein [Streptomyces sp. ITFR-21]
MLVGITTYVEQARWGVWDTAAALLPQGYVTLVQRAGALAVLLPPDRAEAAAEAVARMDAVIVSGGPDVEPGRYGRPRDARTGPAAPERDVWESAVLQAALDGGTPLLGVCRGMQLLNVVLGGTLVQHLDGHVLTPGRFATHRVTPVGGTLLAGLMPAAEVPTHHHQAVDRLGAGLRAGAYADDGTVEAVESAGEGFALGVQWHPEAGADPTLVTALLAAARGRTVTPVT